MIPLRITAALASPVSLPFGSLGLDSLLMWAVAMKTNLGPVGFRPMVDIDIPVAKSPCGRFYLASFSIASWELRERRHINRPFPVARAQEMAADDFTRIQTNLGAQKHFRIPIDVAHAAGDTIAWYALGDAEPMRELLSVVTHVGRRRGAGHGRVPSWNVEPCEPWGEGFPVARDGKPLRPLPLDWPGLVEPMLARVPLMPPYWEPSRAEMCAVAEAAS